MRCIPISCTLISIKKQDELDSLNNQIYTSFSPKKNQSQSSTSVSDLSMISGNLELIMTNRNLKDHTQPVIDIS